MKDIYSPVRRSTDYLRGTVMEPEVTSELKPSYGEYETLGEEHEALENQIQVLNEKMRLSRQRGAFQALQDQMKAVKELVKRKERLDAKMATLDLSRKKDDDHKIAAGLETSYSERLNSVGERIAKLESMILSFSEANAEMY